MADEGIKIITKNRKARHDYHIDDTVEAGIALRGTEVKSLRAGRANLQDAFAQERNGEMYLENCHIAPYEQASHYNHEPTRPRKLLMHKREIEKWGEAAAQQGYTIVPLMLYFKEGYAKVQLGLGKGKKQFDKRQDIARRDAERRAEQAIRRAEKRY